MVTYKEVRQIRNLYHFVIILYTMKYYIILILFSFCFNYQISADAPSKAFRLFSSKDCIIGISDCLFMLNSQNGDVYLASELSDEEIDMFDLKFSWMKYFSFDGMNIDISEYNSPEFQKMLQNGTIKLPTNYNVDKYDFSINIDKGYLLETDTAILYISNKNIWKKVVTNSMEKLEVGSYRVSVINGKIYLLNSKMIYELQNSIWVYIGDFVSD